MLYFVIYAPISPITLVLACSEFLISDLHISSQVIGEKNEVEAKWIKEGCKTSPIGPRRMIQGKKLANQGEAPKRRIRKTTEPLIHRPPHAACGGGLTVVLPGTHGRACVLLSGVSVLFVAVRFPGDFMR